MENIALPPATHIALSALATRVGTDVAGLLDRIASSPDCQDKLADILTIDICLPKRGQYIIAPVQAKYPIPVELHATAHQVHAHLPEKEEGFNAIVKAMGFGWERPDWVRTVNQRAGPIADRLVELGCRLLSAGYIVAVPTAEIRDRIEAGAYAPERTRWIVAVTQGEFAGWFWVLWGRHEDFYRAASRIKGMRYDAPRVVIAPDAADEVLDFAEMFDFTLSDGARQLAYRAQAARGAVTVVTPVAVPAITKQVGKLTRQALEPIESGIADDLADDD